MTRLQNVLADDPNIAPDMLVLCHCPAEYGLTNAWPPAACPPGLVPCRECWNREIPEEAEGAV